MCLIENIYCYNHEFISLKKSVTIGKFLSTVAKIFIQ